MSHVLDDLVDLLSLESIEENLFRGRSQDLGFRQLYGGQVLGQSLSAASQTVEDARHVHSLHGYFLRPGDASLPVVACAVPSPRPAARCSWNCAPRPAPPARRCTAGSLRYAATCRST